MWGVKEEIVAVIVEELGAVTKNLADYLAKIPGTLDLHMCQKICLLGTKRILKFLWNNMESCYQGLKYALSGCLEIHPCVLQDIGPLGPLPCSHSNSSANHSKQGIGYR